MRESSQRSAIPRRWRGAAWSILIGAAVALAALILPRVVVPLRQSLAGLDTAAYDWMFNHRGSEPLLSDIVIVQIDKNAIENLAERGISYPFPRDAQARVLEHLKAAGARVVGVDILFNSERNPAGDQALTRVLRDCSNVILAADFTSSGGADAQQSSSGEDFPASIFRESALGFGPVDIPQDDTDGWVRRFALTLPHISLADITTNQQEYPQFAVCVAAVYRGIPLTRLAGDLQKRRFGKDFIPRSDDFWEAFAPGKSARICFPGRPGRICPLIPYDQVLDAPPGAAGFLKLKNMVEGKVVLIGSTEESEHDSFYTPLQERDDPKRPGVEVQASIVHTLLARHYYATVSEGERRLAVLLAALLTAFVTLILRPWRGAIASVVIGLLFLWLDVSLFGGRVFLRPVAVLGAIGVTYVGETLFLYLVEDARGRELRRHFGRYVGPRVMEKVLEAGHVALSGENRHVAIMFTDLQGFTSISESLAPAEAVDILNAYLSQMVDCIFRHEGTLDKIMGDGIMAYFGAPNSLENPEFAATQCAIEMQLMMRQWRENSAARGMPPLRKRIGIHSGDVIVGEVGSANQVGYTIIGDAVNVAARLEPMNKELGTEILISETVQARLPGTIAVTFRDEVPVRGRKEPIRVYSVEVSQADGTH